MAEHSDPFSAAVSREALFRLVAEHATDIIIRANVEGVIDYVSAACATLGYQPGEVIGRSATDFVHPDDLVRFIDNTRRLISGAVVDRAADREHRFLCKDGSWVWLEGNPQVVRDDSGRPLYIVNIFRDVTEKRLLRDQVAEQARFSKMAEDVGGVGYWRLDAKTREITWSPGMFRAFGLNPSRKPPLDVAMAMVHPDDQKASGRRLARALRTGKGWADDTTRIVRPGGEIRFVLGRAICEVEDGVVRAVFGTMVDVTNQRLAERRYQLMAENVTDMIVTTDTAGKITFVAPSCRAITGYDSTPSPITAMC